jgi:hypothetical protein
MLTGMTIEQLNNAIRQSWAADTSDDSTTWSPENPGRGQCVVTSMVVRDYFGGTLLIAPVLRDGEPVEMHCWNVLPGGAHLDLTADQFEYDYDLGVPVDQQPVVNDTDVGRYEILATRVRQALAGS